MPSSSRLLLMLGLLFGLHCCHKKVLLLKAAAATPLTDDALAPMGTFEGAEVDVDARLEATMWDNEVSGAGWRLGSSP